jgi:hypothetical protein
MNLISQNNYNDDKYVYDIDFERYVDKIVDTDEEYNKKYKLNIIITEKDFFDRDNINYLPNNERNFYQKGSIYTNKNNLNRNKLNNNYSNRNKSNNNYSNNNYSNRNNSNQNNSNNNYSNQNNNCNTILKKVRFSDDIKIIDDINTFREDSPKSIVNFNECSDDVRNKKFNDFIPKGKYVFNKNNSNY